MNSFTCKVCGGCCSGDGSVFLFPEDITELAKNFSMPLQDFVSKYTDFILLEYSDDVFEFSYMPYLVLKKENDTCIFNLEKRCSIHAFKPFQCRSTPFVIEFFTNKKWRSFLKQHCPGLAGMTEKDFAQYRPLAEESRRKNKDYEILLRKNGFSLEKILDIKLPDPKIISVDD